MSENVDIMDLGNQADPLLQTLRNDTVFKFNPGAFPKATSTLSPSTIILIKLHDVGLSNYRETTYGVKTTRTVTLKLDTGTFALMKEVEEALKKAALRLGKINNKKITRDVLDGNFRSRLFEFDDGEGGTFTVNCGEHISVGQTDANEPVDFGDILTFLGKNERMRALRIAVQPTYLWSQTPMKIGISWELKVMVVPEWPLPTLNEQLTNSDGMTKAVLPSLDDLILE